MLKLLEHAACIRDPSTRVVKNINHFYHIFKILIESLKILFSNKVARLNKLNLCLQNDL